jgi:predicted nucleotidyltransferase
MEDRIIEALDAAHEHYREEGFVVLGVFGSRARGDNREDSDLDILYRLETEFFDRYPGWSAAGRLQEIREDLRERIGLEIDIANERALHPVGQKYIIPETVYVSES